MLSFLQEKLIEGYSPTLNSLGCVECNVVVRPSSSNCGKQQLGQCQRKPVIVIVLLITKITQTVLHYAR
jgi:hypothetical protein